MNHNGKGHVLPTLIQFHVRRINIVKVTFNRNSGGRLAPYTHFTAASCKGLPACPESAHTSCLSSWTPAQHSVTAGSYSKCISGSQQCLVLVGWVGLYFLQEPVELNIWVLAPTTIYTLSKTMLNYPVISPHLEVYMNTGFIHFAHFEKPLKEKICSNEENVKNA